MKRQLLTLAVLLLLGVSDASAQSFLNRLKEKAVEKVKEKVSKKGK